MIVKKTWRKRLTAFSSTARRNSLWLKCDVSTSTFAVNAVSGHGMQAAAQDKT